MCCIVICYNYKHIHAEYILTQWIKTNDTVLRKIYLSLYLKGSKGLLKVLQGKGVGDRTELQYIDPHSYDHQLCVFLILQGYSTGGLGAQPLWNMFSFQHLLTTWSDLQTQSRDPRPLSAGCWLSLPHLVSNSSDLHLSGGPKGPFCKVVAFSNPSDLQLTDFLSPPSYIIVQSPTQCLEWHVWSSSSGYNCHAVHFLPVYQSMNVPWDFTSSHIVSKFRLRDFFS